MITPRYEADETPEGWSSHTLGEKADSIDMDEVESDGSDIHIENELTRFGKVVQSLKNIMTLSSFIRFLGAISLIAGMSAFLLQGWGSSSDTDRFLLMLAQTLLMSVAGFGLHFLLKENKGARVFFGLSLLSVTANFAVLGALIYSVIQFDGAHQGLPDFATWIMADLSSLVLCFIAGAVVLIPVSLFGFRLFSRGNTTMFARSYLFSCVLLLLPVREPIVILSLIGLAVFVVTKMIKNRSGVNTWEQKLAIGVIFVPLMVVGVRSLYFYQAEITTVLMLLGLAYYGIRKLVIKRDHNSRLRIIGNVVSLPLAIWISISLIELTYLHFSNDNWIILMAATSVSFLMADLVHRSRPSSYSVLFSSVGVIAISLSVMDILFWNTSLPVLIAALFVNLAWAYLGYLLRSRVMMISGVLFSAILLIKEFVYLLNSIDLNNWVVLSVVGAGAIIFASLSEKYGVAIKLRIEQLVESFKA